MCVCVCVCVLTSYVCLGGEQNNYSFSMKLAEASENEKAVTKRTPQSQKPDLSLPWDYHDC